MHYCSIVVSWTHSVIIATSWVHCVTVRRKKRQNQLFLKAAGSQIIWTRTVQQLKVFSGQQEHPHSSAMYSGLTGVTGTKHQNMNTQNTTHCIHIVVLTVSLCLLSPLSCLLSGESTLIWWIALSCSQHTHQSDDNIAHKLKKKANYLLLDIFIRGTYCLNETGNMK